MFPKTMDSVNFYITWKNYRWDNRYDGMKVVQERLHRIPWIINHFDPMGAMRHIVVVVAVSEMPDLFEAERQIKQAFIDSSFTLED